MKNSSINFEHYKVFYHVATNLSFSKAAQHLYLSQSAISQSIRLLEEQLAVALFIRTTKQVRLTQAGQILFHHIEQAYHLIEIGERNLADLNGLKQGELRLGASDTLCRYYLLSFLTKYKHLYPQIKITLINRPSPICVDLLKKGGIDIALITTADFFSEHTLWCRSLMAISDILIAGSNYADLQSQPLSLDKLQQYPLILLEQKSTTRRYIDDFFAARKVTLNPVMELGSLDLCIDLVKENMGLTFAIKEFVRPYLTSHQLFEVQLKERLPKRHLGLVTHAKIPLPMAAQKFYELLEESDM